MWPREHVSTWPGPIEGRRQSPRALLQSKIHHLLSGVSITFLGVADSIAFGTTARSFYKVFGEALLELPPLSERGRCKITYVVHKTLQQEILRSHASGSVGRRYFGRSALLRSVGVTSVSVTSVSRWVLHRSVGVTPVSNSIVTRKPAECSWRAMI